MQKRFVVPALFAVGVLAVTAMPSQAQSVEAEVATAIVDRMPSGAGQAFPADVGEVFVWNRVTDAEGTAIRHVWMHDGQEWSVTLNIGGSPWRTWSSKVIPAEWTGAWTVEIVAQDGTVLETLTFSIG